MVDTRSKDRSASELKRQYDALWLDVEAEPSQYGRLLAFSREAMELGHAGLAANALYMASRARSTLGDVHQALDLVRQAARCAPSPNPALANKEIYYRAQVLKDAGDHKGSLLDLSRLIKSPHFREIPLPIRVDVFRHLAELCGGVYAHDAVSNCWEQAQWECDAEKQPMLAMHRWLRATSLLDSHLFDGAPLVGLPLLDAVKASVRPDPNVLLVQVEAECHAALRQQDGSLSGARAGLVEVLLAQVRVLQHKDEYSAMACLEQVQKADRRNPYADVRLQNRAMAALLKAGFGAQAMAISGGAQAFDPQRLLPTERLRWRYLRAVVEKACQRPEKAYECYASYAQDHAACIDRMNMQVAEVLSMLAARPGSRPVDAAQRRPAYLDEALLCIRSSVVRMRIADVATQVGVSERTLREAFAVYEGVSPKEFELAERLDRALQHMQGAAEDTQESLEAIGQRFGFSNARRFSTLFRQKHGISVAQARSARRDSR